MSRAAEHPAPPGDREGAAARAPAGRPYRRRIDCAGPAPEPAPLTGRGRGVRDPEAWGRSDGEPPR